jgi:hypothetical protein
MCFGVAERVAPRCSFLWETGVSALHKILSPDSNALSDRSIFMSFLPICHVDRRGRGVAGTTDDSSTD